MGAMLALLSAMSWAASSIFARRGQLAGTYSARMGMFTTLMVNTALNLAMLCGALIIGGGFALNVEGILWFIGGGLLNSCIGRSFMFASIARLGASRAEAIKGGMPVFVLLGGVFLLGETFPEASWIGVICILLGLGATYLDSRQKSIGENTPSKSRLNDVMLGVTACLFLGLGNLCRKMGMRCIPNSIFGVTVGSVTAILVFLLYMCASGEAKNIIKCIRQPDKAYLISGVFTSMALYFLFLSIATTPISIANALTATEPLFTFGMSVFLLKKHEKITPWTVVAGCMIVAGAALLVLF